MVSRLDRAKRLVARALVCSVALGCGEGTPRPTADVVATRIVSLVPSSTDIIVALGGRSRLIARTNFDYAPELASLPTVGGTNDPSVEAIVALRPDLVIVWSDTGVARTGEKLRSLGIRTEAISAATVRDFRQVVTRLGAVLAAPERADSLLRAVTDSFEAVRAWRHTLPRKRVLYVVWPKPIITTGPGTFIDSLIDVAGGTNVFADARSDWPTVELEQVIARDPDVIVWAIEGGRNLRPPLSAPWRRLRAVREGWLTVVEADLLNRPDSRIGRSARILAEAIHGRTP